jgi:hypothetical protein
MFREKMRNAPIRQVFALHRSAGGLKSKEHHDA